MASAFMSTGGMCDASAGYANYATHVSLAKIMGSGMELHVAASSLATGGTRWFSNADPSFSLDCIFASGALSPAMPPHAVDGSLYVDGGIFHNTPVLTALRAGAERVLVILLDPAHPASLDLTKVSKNGVGQAILMWYMNTVEADVFLDTEIREACRTFPHAQIEAVVPNVTVGGTLDFYPDKIEVMRVNGYAAGRDTLERNNGEGFDDLCATLNYTRGLSTAPAPSPASPPSPAPASPPSPAPAPTYIPNPHPPAMVPVWVCVVVGVLFFVTGALFTLMITRGGPCCRDLGRRASSLQFSSFRNEGSTS